MFRIADGLEVPLSHVELSLLDIVPHEAVAIQGVRMTVRVRAEAHEAALELGRQLAAQFSSPEAATAFFNQLPPP
jgi:hypothetical protein|eukprot:595682-Prymnesium_polylepis.5